MSLRDRLYLVVLALFATAFLSINPYPLEFIAIAIILLVAGILLKNKKYL